MENKIKYLKHALIEFQRFHDQTVPLCAAENPISNFCKLPLEGNFQERYITGSCYSYHQDKNFIGSSVLLPFYEMIHDECMTLFHSQYSDPRTLSGMNCLITLLMSLSKKNDKILILSEEWGGHPSVSPVCERLGLQVFFAPYDLEKYDLDYDATNHLVEHEHIQYILIAQSDTIYPLSIKKLNLSSSILLYDISQIMGLITVGVIDNPLQYSNNIIIFGGTHKTLPGPTSGLILTNNKDLYMKLDNSINPQYLRNSQVHQILSLLLALIEMRIFGKDYMSSIVRLANLLGDMLSCKGFHIAQVQKQFSFTHQIFVETSQQEMERIFLNAIRYGVTLNKKEKSLFGGYGIRLGVQEIARYGWDINELEIISDIFKEISKLEPNGKKIEKLKANLPEKKIQYTFPPKITNGLKKFFLHKN